MGKIVKKTSLGEGKLQIKPALLCLKIDLRSYSTHLKKVDY